MPIRPMLLMGISLLFLYLLFTVGSPFLLALVLAVFLEPLTLFLMNKFNTTRTFASLISSSFFTFLLLFLLSLLGMKLFSELKAFFDKLPGTLHQANHYFRQFLENAQLYSDRSLPSLNVQLRDWFSNVLNALAQLSTQLSSVLFTFASGIPNFFIFFLVFLIALFLFGLTLPTVKLSFLDLFEERSHSQVEAVLDSLRSSIFGFLRAQIFLSSITYLLSFVGLLIIGTSYPLAIALVIVVVDLLPILGIGTALLPWALYCLMMHNYFMGTSLILLFLLLTIVRRIVEPKVIGEAVGIGALSALISVYVGYKLVGLVGVFLGPIVVIVFMGMRKAGLLDFKIKFF